MLLIQMDSFDIRRFWSKVDKTGDCWIFTGTKNTGGYGIIKINGSFYVAHRISFFLSNNNHIDNSLMVLHKCDTRDCVRPDPLYQGDGYDNMVDMMSRQRRDSQTKLTIEDIKRIRELFPSMSHTQIAEIYGVRREHIGKIVRRQEWAWVE